MSEKLTLLAINEKIAPTKKSRKGISHQEGKKLLEKLFAEVKFTEYDPAQGAQILKQYKDLNAELSNNYITLQMIRNAVNGLSKEQIVARVAKLGLLITKAAQENKLEEFLAMKLKGVK